ncbi:MAG: DUF2281 domain-containing protein [Saprospiraceae bacterium]|nr:DUF2281 domain-containing protein [Saprospiraceae bacterium]
MVTLSLETYISGHNPVIPLPEIPEGNYDVVVVLQPKSLVEPPEYSDSVEQQPRKAGFIQGIITMSEDFNMPLEDFKEYM